MIARLFQRFFCARETRFKGLLRAAFFSPTPRLGALIIGLHHNIPFNPFPSLRHLQCIISDPTKVTALLKHANQLISLRVDCQRCSARGTLPNSSITSNLLELHLHTRVPEIVSYISFPVLTWWAHPWASRHL